MRGFRSAGKRSSSMSAGSGGERRPAEPIGRRWQVKAMPGAGSARHAVEARRSTCRHRSRSRSAGRPGIRARVATRYSELDEAAPAPAVPAIPSKRRDPGVEPGRGASGAAYPACPREAIRLNARSRLVSAGRSGMSLERTIPLLRVRSEARPAPAGPPCRRTEVSSTSRSRSCFRSIAARHRPKLRRGRQHLVVAGEVLEDEAARPPADAPTAARTAPQSGRRPARSPGPA